MGKITLPHSRITTNKQNNNGSRKLPLGKHYNNSYHRQKSLTDAKISEQRDICIVSKKLLPRNENISNFMMEKPDRQHLKEVTKVSMRQIHMYPPTSLV